MPRIKVLYQNHTSIRALPRNFDILDLALFEHELKRELPEITLSHLNNVTLNSDGILFNGFKVLVESFPSQRFMKAFLRPKTKLKLWAKNCFPKKYSKIDGATLWITDIWSQGYFHWMTDALPRLFVIQSELDNATLLLPRAYQGIEYIQSSLKPFPIQKLEFVHKSSLCKSLKIPSHTAPTGNYNEEIIRSLRETYAGFYRDANSEFQYDKVYISRGKSQKRKISNEEECISVLEEFGFITLYFEDYSFEQQVKIISGTKYLISNHGAGLTNMLFMKAGGSILELRRTGDSQNNCYFALASALHLNYFYQLCNAETPEEDSHTANLVVDCGKLRKNLKHMLDYEQSNFS
jgi:capsular polysaccharide biosynthesis protein